MSQFQVSFLPDGASALVPAGATLLEAAAAAHVAIDAPCGDRGICGKCRVQRMPPDSASLSPLSAPRSPLSAPTGLEPPTLPERSLIPPEELAEGWRLACQARVSGDLVVRVPERALKPAVVPLSQVEPRPAVRKIHVAMAEPTIEDPAADATRLRLGLGDAGDGLQIALPVLRRLPAALAGASYDVTAVMAGNRLVAVEPGDTTGGCYGLAVDLGTTSVVAILADLNSGRVLGVESRLNGQANFGADVVSRICHATESPEGLAALQAAAVSTINAAVAALSERTGVAPTSVYEVVVVGNTCMNHLFLSIDPRSLAAAPYQPVVTDPVVGRAADLGLAVHPEAVVYTLPNIAGFVGSDTVAVILATGLHRSEEVRLAIDLGTNGEMVLGNRERLLACSTAAGPAFEGARISQGMRATEGAIERVWIDGGAVKVQVIGGAAPIGICGSGLLDAVAQLVGAGILNRSGRMVAPESPPPTLAPELARRLGRTDGKVGFVLARRGRRPVVLTQTDVRELQLAKGAVRAGVSIMLKELGLGVQDIAEVVLAGAFGSYISPASARALGLVPPLPLDRITAVGNAAGQGAAMALLSTDQREEASRIARFVQYVELSARADFMEEFTEALALASA